MISDSSLSVEGRTTERIAPRPDEAKRDVSCDYFRAIGIPLIRGRFFTISDHADAPPVIIVNQALARKYWPNQDAVGKRIAIGGMSSQPQWITIVGIVAAL